MNEKQTKGKYMSKKIITVEDLTVQVEKKTNLKKLYIKVLSPDASIRVSAPKRISDSFIKNMVKIKMEEIKKAVIEVRRKFPETISLTTGDRLFLWGKDYRLIVEKADKSDVFVLQDSIVMQVKSQEIYESFEKKKKLLYDFYKRQLDTKLPEFISFYEKKIGVRVNEYRVKNMRTRWGTCNIDKKRIWISLQLVKKPMHCLEYVVVHELVHLLERYHNQRFYGFLDQFYPQWKLATRDLKA